MTEFEMELTQKYARDYARGDKRTKSAILDEYCRLSGAGRNTAAQRFRRKHWRRYPGILPSSRKPRGRPARYRQPHRRLVRAAWELAGEICAERMHEELGTYLSALEAAGETAGYGRRVIEEVRALPLGTLKAIMAEFPKSGSGRGRSTPSEVLDRIPVQPRFGQFAHRHGYVGMDYVEHCGSRSDGRYAVTGTYTELYSGWCARAAGYGKNLASVEAIHGQARDRLPMPIRHFHADNAPATFRCLLEQLDTGGHHCTLSRSRPYRKNDNAHVEQKNGDKVRKLVGHFRLDTAEAVHLLNRLYETEDAVSNFFIPSAKLTGKEYDRNGRIVRKHYDRPRTPYRRVLDSSKINNRTKRRVVAMYQGLDMVALRGESDRLQRELSQYFTR